MKKSNPLVLILVFGVQLAFYSQNSKNFISSPSDVSSGFTYDFNKAQSLIIERISKPDESNKDAEILLTQNSFPKLNKNEKIEGPYKEKLKDWMEKNPNLIISAFKNRKEIVQAY